jgi:hypothetical protein
MSLDSEAPPALVASGAPARPTSRTSYEEVPLVFDRVVRTLLCYISRVPSFIVVVAEFSSTVFTTAPVFIPYDGAHASNV